MIVYVDSLFLVNFFMDTVLLYISSLSLRRVLKPFKLMAGAIFLSLYGTITFFADLNIFVSTVFKITAVVIAILLSYGKEKIIKNSIMFLVTTSLSGGIIFAISWCANYGIVINTSVSNGTFYMNINPLILILGSGLIYLSAWFLRRIYIKNYSRERLIEKIKFFYGGKEYIIKCLIDTGCCLTEPLSNEPLMIMDKDILSVTDGAEIVINTINGKSKIKLIFPENIEAINKSVTISKKTPIGISANKINADDIYNGILNPDAILNDRKEEYKCHVS